MTWPLDPHTALQLAEICDSFDGASDAELILAARQAHDLVRERGLSWELLLAPDYPRLISFALGGAEFLQAHERAFLFNINRSERLTAKQITWLFDLCDRVKAGRKAA